MLLHGVYPECSLKCQLLPCAHPIPKYFGLESRPLACGSIVQKGGGSERRCIAKVSLPRCPPRSLVHHAALGASAAAATTALGFASGAPHIELCFTPTTAALGGVLLGIATAGKLLLTGRILGISGTFKGLVTGDWAPWRFAFVGGLTLGALVLQRVLPGAFECINPSFPLWRAAAAGLLVGLGTALGNGCTSGHGICGSARLSPRSFAYIAAFMASGIITANLAHTPDALSIAPLPAVLAAPSAPELRLAAAAAVAAVAAYSALAAVARLTGGTRQQVQTTTTTTTSLVPDPLGGGAGGGGRAFAALEAATEVVSGLVFALGLGVSGMSRPSKAAGFLSAGLPSWDLSLLFTMAGAVAVALVAFQGVMRFRIMLRPVLCPRFQIPTNSAIDTRLMVGGVLFGAGWGISGLCPGPELVVATQGDPRVLAFIAAMASGMWIESRVSRAIDEAKKKGGAQ